MVQEGLFFACEWTSVASQMGQCYHLLDRTDKEAEFQLRLNQIQQQSANCGRIKYQNMEISANIWAIHPQRKRLNGRNDCWFVGI